MNLVGRSSALGWMITILVVQVSAARHSRWALNAKTQALWDLSPQELECVHNFLVNRRELQLQSSKELTLAKNSVFLIEMLKPKKYEVLDFLDNGAMPPVREARVLIYFGAQEYPNVTEYAVGPVEQPMYMRKLSRKGGQELSWASRPMSKVESVLLFHTLKTATEPLQEFFFDITGFTLQDCNGGCLTFTNVAPRAMTFRKRLSWFLLQRLVNGYFLQPTGLELLVDHGSTDAQDWRVEQLWYNGKFYNSPEELAQKYADGEVAIVVLEDPLPKISPQYSTYKASAEFPMPISKGGPRVFQSSAEFQIPISKGGPRVFQSSAEFQIPISKGGPRVLQPSAEFQIPISKGGPRVLQSSAEFQIPISKGGPRVFQPSAESQIPISKGGPRVLQSSSEFQIPISKGGPRVFQPSAEFQIPISKGGPRVHQSSAEFQIPISKGGPRVFQPSAESRIPISKGGPRVLQSSSEFQIPISKGGPRVLQSSSEFQIPISKGGPRVLQPSAEFQIPISKGGPRVLQSSSESQIPISKGGPRVFQPSAEFQIPISKGGPRVLQSSAESQIPISKGGPRVFQSSAESQIPISKGGPRVFQPSAESQIPISKGGPRVLQSSSEFQIPISKGGPRVFQPSAESRIPISKGGPRVLQPSVPPYSLKHNTVIYGDWSFFFKLHSSYGLQLFNVYFGGERIAYEIGVQEVMALYRGHAAEGRETKYVDVGWGLGGITHQLTPGIDCPDTATFLDASHYYDSDGPVLYQRALCIFEVPKGVPLRRHFNSNFRDSFSSHARLNGPMLVLRTTSTIHNHDYIWDFVFHLNGVMEGKMYASDYVHATFYTSEGLVHSTHPHSHLLGNVHSHLAHYRIDLDVAGTKNRFQTLRTRVESITSPWTRRSQQVKPILDKTQHFWERQAAFHFRQTLPKYLLFSNAGKSVLGHSRSYRLQIPSVPEQMLPPGWQSSPAFTWPRYQLAVTKYQEAERFHSSLYNQNHHWAYPMVFEDFVHNNENIKDEDLVAWVTVGLSHHPQSEDGPNMATQENSAGFLLQPFDFFQGFQRYTGLKIQVDYESTDAQDWRVEPLWYNGKFYNSPEELAQKYADGEMDKIFNVLFPGEGITYETSMQVAVALYGGHTPAGMQIEYMDVSWGLNRVNCQLTPALTGQTQPLFWMALYYYDTEYPIPSPGAPVSLRCLQGAP